MQLTTTVSIGMVEIEAKQPLVIKILLLIFLYYCRYIFFVTIQYYADKRLYYQAKTP